MKIRIKNILLLHKRYYESEQEEMDVGGYYDEMVELLKYALTNGSGIDCEWEFEISEKKIVCKNSYHKMNEHGGYCGYQYFEIIIKTGHRDIYGELDYKLRIKGRDVNNLKEYLEDTIYSALEGL